METKTNAFPFYAATLLASFSLLSIYPDLLRMDVSLQPFFLILKIGTALLSGSLAVYFYKEQTVSRDWPRILFFVTCLIYSLGMMWILPLYEIAYLQCAVGSAFFRIRRKWLFPMIFGAGAVGVALTYHIQDSIGWKLPPSMRKDWLFVIAICFVLSCFIQRYAIEANRRGRERLLRLSRIGHETNRLLHDVKGMMSSPLMTLEAISEGEGMQTAEEYKQHLKSLNSDMRYVRDVLASVNRMTRSQKNVTSICLRDVVVSSLMILERRLQQVEIVLPEARTIFTDADILRSVLFNLFLNTVEAFERNRVLNRSLQIYWDNNTLVYKDNAGKLEKVQDAFSQFSGNSGIGMEILKSDLESLGIGAQFKSQNTGMEVRMKFSNLIST